MKLKNYLDLIRFDKPTGTYLLLLPGLWGLFSGFNVVGHYDQKILLIFVVGSFLMRSAGCIINDYFDRDFDKKVERTKMRPLASGAVSVKEAFAILALLLMISLGLLLQLNNMAIVILLASMILVVGYPLVKRFSFFPQLVLGLAFNIGALAGYAAVVGHLDFLAVALYLAGVLWTLGYDTIYGLQDIDDDLKIGVKSTSIYFANHMKLFLVACYSTSYGLFVLYGRELHFSQIYYAIITLLTCTSFFYIWQLDQANKPQLLKGFKLNVYYGIVVLIAIIIS